MQTRTFKGDNVTVNSETVMNFQYYLPGHCCVKFGAVPDGYM